MNTPDLGPKDGDFVAYIAELERRQLQAHRISDAAGAHAKATGAMPPTASVPSTQAKSGATFNRPIVAVTPDQLAGIVKSLPVGLVVIGVALVVAGLALDGGFILALLGLFMLVQAVRGVLKAAAAAAAARPDAGGAAQQVATLLAARPQPKTPAPK